MIKAVLFDVDGLVIIREGGYFSEHYAREYGVPIEKVTEFFTGDFKKCTFGQSDLREEIAPHLQRWGWEGTVDDFLKHWFEYENDVDSKVLAVVKQLRDNGLSCHIATRQEKHRTAYFWNTLNLKQHFDGIFSTCDIGYDKSEAGFWDKVTGELGLAPEEILFFDDSQKNIDFTQEYGIQSYLYTGFDILEEKVENLLARV